MLRLAASSPAGLPVAASPAGSVQLKVGTAAPPLADCVFQPPHSGAAVLQFEEPKASVSQTKRRRLPAAGVARSVTTTLVA